MIKKGPGLTGFIKFDRFVRWVSQSGRFHDVGLQLAGLRLMVKMDMDFSAAGLAPSSLGTALILHTAAAETANIKLSEIAHSVISANNNCSKSSKLHMHDEIQSQTFGLETASFVSWHS